MGTHKVGIREFREKLSAYLLESDEVITITRHGETVGYYIPTRRKRSSEAEREAREITQAFQEWWRSRRK